MNYKIKIFDFEVFTHDWLVVFSDLEGKDVQVIHNNNKELKKVMLEKGVLFGGYNVKHYDNWIAQAIIAGCSPEEVKACNDWIIAQGRDGWTFPLIKGMRREFISFDLMDDLAVPISLKAIEGNCCDCITESEVDFNIDHPLTEAELEDTIFYCKRDVEATVKLYHLRKAYIQGKLDVGALKGWDASICLPLTNPKLTAKFLGAKRQDHDDEFTYDFPKDLRLEKYTTPLEFYKEVSYDKNLELDVCGVTQHYGWGGLHSAREHYIDESTDDYMIVDIDVGSYYPSLMLKGFISRNIPSAKGYEEIYHRRLEAKHSGRDAEASALKLVLNSTYGATKDKFNDLYDAKQCNQVCISGELYLTDLCEKLEDIEGMTLIQTNTDGIMIGYPRKHEAQMVKIVEDFTKRTNLQFEYTAIKRICCQKDVNNYVMVMGETWLYKDGQKVITKPDKNKIAVKGGWASLYNGGTWLNNSMVIVHKALVDYFVYGTTPEETINKATNIFDFQIICKTSFKFDDTVHEVNGEDIHIQRCNRVYASKDEKLGMVYKLKGASKSKFPDIPEHCIIDNDNKLSLDDVDKDFYIKLAWKRINDYKGTPEEKPKKTKARKEKAMATPKAEDFSKLNLMQKLNKARLEFLNLGIKKGGKNRAIGYMYYELEDIVPAVLPIFDKYGIYHETAFLDDTAYMRVFNADNPDECPREYMIPMAHMEGNRGMNPAQVMGGMVTYYTRYLYLSLMQIVEADVFDASQNEKTPEEKPKAKAPATPEQKQEAVAELTGGNMTMAQKTSIVNGLKKLRASGGDHEKYIAGVQELIKKWKADNTVLSTNDAETIMIEIGELLKGDKQ